MTYTQSPVIAPVNSESGGGLGCATHHLFICGPSLDPEQEGRLGISSRGRDSEKRSSVVDLLSQEHRLGKIGIVPMSHQFKPGLCS
jgi:hypothetical protein